MIDVLAVCGDSHMACLRHSLVPSLANSAGGASVSLHILNYASRRPLLPQPFRHDRLVVKDWSARRRDGRLGFGEAVNVLFDLVSPREFFVCINPDTYVDAHLLSSLQASLEEGVGIVEARQWPSEHPKEYDPESGDTPWASGACFAARTACFEQLGGFDPGYFMYCEDVDISWRAWLAGWRVKYEPTALCHHYTGSLSHRNDRFYLEHFYTARNFLALNYKFFGDEGERSALELLKMEGYPGRFMEAVQAAYFSLKPRLERHPGPVAHEQIKVLGFNRFHKMRARRD